MVGAGFALLVLARAPLLKLPIAGMKPANTCLPRAICG